MSRAGLRRLEARGPFNLVGTVRLLQRRPTNLVDRLEGAAHVRLFDVAGGPVLATTLNRGSLEVPDVRVQLSGGTPEARRAVIESLHWMLGLDHDADVLDSVGIRDRRLAGIAQSLRGVRPPRYPHLFEAFANAIPFQQVSLESGTAVVSRIVERLGRRAQIGGRTFFAFPRARAVASAGPAPLRAAGLSDAKARNLWLLAQLVADRKLDSADLQELPTPLAEAELRELPGIGPWSAALVLLRGLGRLDAFPNGDVGAARGLARLLGESSDRFSAEEYAEQFGEARGYLYFFSLGAHLLEQGLIPAASSVPASPAQW